MIWRTQTKLANSNPRIPAKRFPRHLVDKDDIGLAAKYLEIDDEVA